MERQPAVYILASRRNGTLYIGVTSNLQKRIWGTQERFRSRIYEKMRRSSTGLLRAARRYHFRDLEGEADKKVEPLRGR